MKLKKGSTETYGDSADGKEIDEVALEELAAHDGRSSATVKVTMKRKSGHEPLKNGTRGRKKKKRVKWSSVNAKDIWNGDEDDTATATAISSTTLFTTRQTRTMSHHMGNGMDHHESAVTPERLNNVNYGGDGCDGDGRSSNGHKSDFRDDTSRRLSSTEEETAANGIGLSNNTLPDRSLVGRVVKIYSDGEWKASRVIRAHTKKPFFYLLEPLSSSRKYAAKEWTSLNGSVMQFMFSSGIVWGRCKGYPAWPGIKFSLSKATKESKILKHNKSSNCLVIFFGTNESAWLPENRTSTFEPTPKQLDSPLDMLTKGHRKKKALAQAVKDAVKELVESRRLVDASTVDELALFTSQLSGPASWVGLHVRATKSRKGADCGVVRAYSAAQRKWLIVWKGGNPCDPPPPPAWYGRHALQLAALPDKEMEAASLPPLPGSGICRMCCVEKVNDDVTGLPLPVLKCFKCNGAYHGFCLDPPVPNSVIASAAAIQARQTPPCDDDSYLSEHGRKKEQLQGEKKEEGQLQHNQLERRELQFEANEEGKRKDDAENNSIDEEEGRTASATAKIPTLEAAFGPSAPVNGVEGQEKEQNVIKCEGVGTSEQQPGIHSADDDNSNMPKDLISAPCINSGGEKLLVLSDHESLSAASGGKQETSVQKQPKRPGNESNVMTESDVQIMRKVEERGTADQAAEKDLPKLRSLLPGAENGQWICDGCIVCHGCGVSKHSDSTVRLHEKNPVSVHISHGSRGDLVFCFCVSCRNEGLIECVCYQLFFCFKMDHGIEDDIDFPSFDIFGHPPPSHSMLCKACTSRFASGSLCPICEFTWKDEEEQCNLLGCDLCHFWVHAECEGFSNEEFMLIQLGKHQVYGEGSR